ncbi:MAG: hypothetical protein CL808_01310 [Citromicrobium sp.]|nr:hypothetical protein [Citromicrobium sp.]|tara:strand:+ start:404 stop:718 length:315 start_codon:yes stop_codon:yes gene_type:complete
MAVCLVSLICGAAHAQTRDADAAVLVQVDSGIESEYFDDTDRARRELAEKVEMAARMACADSWTPRSTIYESIDYTVDWSASDGRRSGRRKAIARNISVRCRLD